jgi:hypothetical protein
MSTEAPPAAPAAPAASTPAPDSMFGGGNPPASPPPSAPPVGTPPPSAPPAATAAPWFAKLFTTDGKIDKTAYESAPDNVKKFRTSLEQYETPEALFHALGHNKSLVGAKALSRLPADAPQEAKDAQMKILREVQGAPEKVDGYKITKPEGLPEGAQWDEKGMGEYAAIAHKYAIPEAAFEEFKAAQIKSLGGQIASVQAEQQAQLQAEFAALDKGLPAGVTREQYMGEATKGLTLASKLTGIPVEELKANTKTARDVKLFAAFAQIAGEDKMIAAAADAGGVNYDTKINELMNSKEFLSSEESVRAPVRAEVRRLLTLQSKLKK